MIYHAADGRTDGGCVTVKGVLSYHFNRAECNNGVTTPAVGPGIPARILPLLKHILLPLTAGLLVSHPSERAEEEQMDGCEWCRGKAGKKTSVTCVAHIHLFFWTFSSLPSHTESLSLCVTASVCVVLNRFLLLCLPLTPTHGPHSTSMEPTFSTSASWRLLQGPVSSWQRPWKFSCS